ncbi:hypothetical protein KAU87_04265 [Candidatus Bathyarchaeota archaeon]|nr:hypothetical protein [Candidatus Bathyarchaeota archaeon]
MLNPGCLISNPNFNALVALSWPIISLRGVNSSVVAHIPEGSAVFLSISAGNSEVKRLPPIVII